MTSSLRSSPRDLPQKDGCCALVRNTHACTYAPSHIKLNNLLHSSSSVQYYLKHRVPQPEYKPDVDDVLMIAGEFF